MGLAVALSMTVLAATSAEAKRPHRSKVILVDLPADKSFDVSVIKVVNSLMAKDLRDLGFDVITGEDIGAALGVEKERQLLGCTDSSCMAEIGGALGAEYIVHGDLATIDANTALTLTLTDANGHGINEVGGIVEGKTATVLVAAVQQAIPKLVKPVAPAEESAGQGAGSNLTTVAPATTASPSPAAAASVASPGVSHIPSYVAVSVGGLLLIGSAVSGALASSDYGTLKNDALVSMGAPNLTAIQSLRSRESAEAWVSTGALVGGLVAAGVGVALWFLAGPDSQATPAVTAGGGSVAMRF